MHEDLKNLKLSGKYYTTQEALGLFREAGIPMCIVTMHRLARERGFLFQPRGKKGECFLEREKVLAFLEHGGSHE